MPTVCANIYTATDLCPASSSRLQRRQYKFSKGPPGGFIAKEEILSSSLENRKYAEGFPRSQLLQHAVENQPEPSCALARCTPNHALCSHACWCCEYWCRE